MELKDDERTYCMPVMCEKKQRNKLLKMDLHGFFTLQLFFALSVYCLSEVFKAHLSHFETNICLSHYLGSQEANDVSSS